MDWQSFAVFLGVWTVGSLPLAILIGKAIAHADLRQQAYEAAYKREVVLLPAPALRLPDSLRIATTESVTASATV